MLNPPLPPNGKEIHSKEDNRETYYGNVEERYNRKADHKTSDGNVLHCDNDDSVNLGDFRFQVNVN